LERREAHEKEKLLAQSQPTQWTWGRPGAHAPSVGGGRLKLPRPSAARPALPYGQGSQAVWRDYSCDRRIAPDHSGFARKR